MVYLAIIYCSCQASPQLIISSKAVETAIQREIMNMMARFSNLWIQTTRKAAEQGLRTTDDNAWLDVFATCIKDLLSSIDVRYSYPMLTCMYNRYLIFGLPFVGILRLICFDNQGYLVF